MWREFEESSRRVQCLWRGEGQMKYALRAAIVAGLTYVYLRVIYLSDLIDHARTSPSGRKAYFFLAGLFNAQNVDECET